VFKNLVFNTRYAPSLRAVDISVPQTPREVGYALTLPHGIARTYPIVKDGFEKSSFAARLLSGICIALSMERRTVFVIARSPLTISSRGILRLADEMTA
jgi:hypothetical protein